MTMMAQARAVGLVGGSEPNPCVVARGWSRGGVRIARVRAVRRLIAAGKYRVSSADVAAKMLRAMREGDEGNR